MSVLWIYKNHLQVTIGIFTLDCKKASSNYLKLGSSSSSQIAAFGTPTGDAYQGPSSNSSGDNDNIPFNQLPGIYNNATHPIPTMSMYRELWDRQTQQWGRAFRLTDAEACYLLNDYSMLRLQIGLWNGNIIIGTYFMSVSITPISIFLLIWIFKYLWNTASNGCLWLMWLLQLRICLWLYWSMHCTLRFELHISKFY